MIKLCVEDYCQNCSMFEADVEKPPVVYDCDYSEKRIGDTVIRCKNRDLCGAIKRYLENKEKYMKEILIVIPYWYNGIYHIIRLIEEWISKNKSLFKHIEL